MDRPRPCFRLSCLAALWLSGNVGAQDLVVAPAEILLDSPDASQQVLVTGRRVDGSAVDLTNIAQYRIVDPGIATVDERGAVRPLSDGETEITITWSTDVVVLRVPVTVRGIENPRPVSFEDDVAPILTKARCNSGGCHGKAEGQNGFKLSVFGFDPVADHAALVKESRGRRVLASAPSESLLLRKATATSPHGGGRKLDRDSLHYRRIERWIAEGAQLTRSTAPLLRIEVEPAERIMGAGETQQLRVTAVGADGERRCVTAEAEYESTPARSRYRRRGGLRSRRAGRGGDPGAVPRSRSRLPGDASAARNGVRASPSGELRR
jgi:hypothetical protein